MLATHENCVSNFGRKVEIMKQPDIDTFGSIVRLSGNPDWERCVKWLNDSFAEMQDQMLTISEDRLSATRSQASVLQEITEFITSAPDVIREANKYDREHRNVAAPNIP